MKSTEQQQKSCLNALRVVISMDPIFSTVCICLVYTTQMFIKMSFKKIFIISTKVRHIHLSMGFPMQEYWSELPFPSPSDLPNPEIKAEYPAVQVDSLPLSHLEAPV